MVISAFSCTENECEIIKSCTEIYYVLSSVIVSPRSDVMTMVNLSFKTVKLPVIKANTNFLPSCLAKTKEKQKKTKQNKQTKKTTKSWQKCIYKKFT